MLTICWAAKGGSGTTVASCGLALVAAQQRDVWLIDLAGDAPAALGISEPPGPGVNDWIDSATASPTAIEALGVAINARLRLVPRGAAFASADDDRWDELGRFLAERDAPTFVDAGSGNDVPRGLLGHAQKRLLVTRACYLALRRAVAGDLAPTGVIVVREPGRALTAQDVAFAVHAPVVAEIEVDVGIARAVDAGLLAARIPRTLSAPLRDLALSELTR